MENEFWNSELEVVCVDKCSNVLWRTVMSQ